MRQIFSVLILVLAPFVCKGQTTGPDSIFTFECICGFLSPQDTNCDICSNLVESRFFRGMLIRRYGVPYKWLDEPYIVKFKGQNATFEELIPLPEKITIAMSATVFDTLPNYKAAIQCPCSGKREYQPGDGIYFTGGDTINAIDADSLNEAWTITDGSSYELISNDTVTFTGAGGATVTYDSTTNTVTITSSGGGGGDNWGTQVVITDASLTGDGTAGNQLGIDDYSVASNGQVPSKSASGITWINVDGSTTNEIQVLTAGDGVGDNKTLDLSLSGGTVTLDPAGILTMSRTGNTLVLTATEVDGSTTNEVQSYAHSGTTTYTNTLSLGGGSFTLQGSGIVTISHTAGTVTITGTEVDGSTTNEAWTIDGDDVDTEVISNQTVKFQGAGIATTDYNPTTNVLLITATEVDGSTTNEVQSYAHSGTTSYTNTLSLGGGSFTLQSAGITTISHTAGTVTITSTEVDGSTTNEVQSYAHSGTATYTNTLSLGGGSFTLQPAGIVTISHTTGTVTISATEVDGSTSNEIQSYAHSGTTSYTNTLSLGGGTFTLQAAGITTISHTAGTVTITSTEVDGSTSNEIQSYAHSGTTSYTNTLSLGGGAFTLQASGIASISHTAGTVTISATEVDGSTTNEGILGVSAGISTTSVITSNTSGANGVTISVAGILTIGETTSSNGGTITLTATEVDGSTTNEVQSYAHSGTTSYTNTLSLGGGSFTLQSAGITTISHTAGTVTITSTEVDGSTSNEIQSYAHSGTTSYTNTLSLGGGSFTLQSGGIVAISNSAGTVTISATEVDGSTTNEVQSYGHSGTTSYTNTLSIGGGSFTLQASGIASISHTAGTVTISATEVDGSTTNEAWTIDGDDVDTEVISNQTVKFQGAGITTTDYNPITDVLLITSTEVDGSTSNEVQSYGHSGTTSYTNTLSLGGGSFTLQASGIASISHTAGTVTISATEVDGSTTNEVQSYAHSGTTSYTNTLSLGGGAFTLQSGGITTISHTAGTVTITSTEVDGSTTNEAWTIDGDDVDTEVISNQTVKFQGAGITATDYNAATNVLLITSTEVDGSTTNEVQSYGHSGTTSYTNTLSLGGGSFTLQASGIASISHTAGTVTISATEVDGSTTNEAWTIDGDDVDTEVISNQTVKFQGAGIATTDYNPGTDVLLITATEVDGSTSNEIQSISANGAGPTSYTIDLSLGGGAVTLSEGSGVDLTRSGNTITIASTAGGITAANNGLYVSGTTVRMGTNPLLEATIIDQNGFEYRHSDGKISITNQLVSYTAQGADFGIEGTENNPTINSTPTKDAIIELRASSTVGSAQGNSLSIGAYVTDADGIWIQARSQAVPNFEYPLSLQPRGEKMSVGRIGGLDALVTFAGTGLAGSGIAGQVLHLENNEGNGKTSMSLGAGTDQLDSELAWYDASDALRLTNRSNVSGTSTVRVAIGGETSDIAIFQTSATAPNSRFGIGFNSPSNITSTLQSGGSMGAAILTTVGAVTLDERHHVVIYTGTTNQTWTLPTASTCTGRHYVLCHRNTTGTITLSDSVNKGNAGNFNTLTAGQWAMIWSDGSAWTGYKLTSL